MKLYIPAIFAVSVFILSSGCVKTYNQQLLPVKKDMKSGKYDKALSGMDKTGLSRSNKDSLLYHLEAGLLYHLAGKYKESNKYFENAEWISDELYTKSLSQETAALVISDKILPYRGEFYDYLYTNYYKLLNYLYLGSLEDALVEVRRINHKLSLFNQDNAFMHYLTAILYQYNNQISDSFIEYKKAYKAYKNYYPQNYGVHFPAQLSRDISVFCRESRFSRCSEFPSDILYSYKAPPNYGSVVFIIETGFVPYKYEEKIEVAIPQKYKKKHSQKLKDIYYLTIALPEYISKQDWIDKITLNLDGKGYKMDLVEDIGTMAIKTFRDEKSKIFAKAIARAIAKYITYKKVRGKEKSDKNENLLRKILGTSVNILGTVTEQADTRSWLTLPNRIFLSRHYLVPGEYDFELTIKSAKGIRKSIPKRAFRIKKEEIKFIVLRQFLN